MEEEENFNDILRELEKAINDADNPKNENYQNRKKTIYDYVAELSGLEHKFGNTYLSTNNGKSFIRTKFGFQPEEAFNKGLQLRQLRIQHEQTLTDFEDLKRKHQKKCSDFMEAKNELEKLRSCNKELENQLAQTIKSTHELNKQFNACKETLTSVTALKKDFENRLNELNQNYKLVSIYKKVIDDMKNEPNPMGKYYNKIIAELVAKNNKLSKEIAALTKKEI